MRTNKISNLEKMRKTINSLEKKGMIELRDKNGEEHIRLTEKGLNHVDNDKTLKSIYESMAKKDMDKDLKNIKKAMNMDWDIDKIKKDSEMTGIMDKFGEYYTTNKIFKKIMDEIGDFKNMHTKREELVDILGEDLYRDMFYFFTVSANALDKLFAFDISKPINKIGLTRMRVST